MNGETRPGQFKVLVKRALRAGLVGEAVRRVAAFRGRSLVLVYHRVDESEPPTRGVVPFVPSRLFRRQLEALRAVGEIVPLETLIPDPDRYAKPRFALTFDDDYVSHVDHVLPVLQDLDVPATFFLSGRALHGLGSYWFELLEGLIWDRGVAEVSRLLHTRSDGVDALVAACESNPTLQKILEAEGTDAPRHLGHTHIEALTAAGMAVGFHTLDHQILTRLGDGELEAAVTIGRIELEELVGRPVRHFAYPHGKADGRTAVKVRDAGYDAAWTGRPQAMHRRDDRYLLGRWEPGGLEVEDFLVGATIRLTRGAHPWPSLR